MITVSRAEWNARPPTYTNALTLSQVSLFIVHYSGEVRSQTVRSIQDYCMDTKNHSDIDYNAIVKDGKHYVGRAWNKGGHTLNHNSISYGVCVVGRDGDATAADMNCIREIYDMVCAKLGRQITKTTHRNVLGASYTDCPGNELDAWVDAGMPLMGDDMSWDIRFPNPGAPDTNASAAEYLVYGNNYAFRSMNNTAAILAVLEKIAEKVDLDPAELEQVKAAASEGALAGVLGSVDELIAAFKAALPDDVASREDVVSALREVLRTGVGQ